MIQLVDLDGCISDDRWRRHWIDHSLPETDAKYLPYHIRHASDPVANRWEVRHPYIVITARPVVFHDTTRVWLEAKGFPNPLHMIMRNRNDHRPSVELKRMAVRWLLDPQLNYGIQLEDIVDAIDDREDIVQMYRSEFGINARRVACP